MRLIATLILSAAMLAVVAYAAGDPVRGKQLATECFACHGQDGNSPSPVNPKLGGQHELYLLLALKAYVDGTRANSLMRGAVLNKSAQDLEDIAAYYASQSPMAPDPSAPADRGGPPGGIVKFDHGERTAAFTAMQARAAAIAAQAVRVSANEVCNEVRGDANVDADEDRDGLSDRYDADPENSGEFVADRNDDGLFEICNVHQLQAIATLGTADGTSTSLSAEQRRRRSYQLVRDLDAATIENFQPIGNCGPTGNCMRALGQFGFAGVFDGQGHAIRNLRMSHTESGGVSLFGVLAEPGVVMNLRLIDVDIEGRAGTGGIVGSNFGTVFNCSVAGSVTGNMAIGGLVGGSGGLVMSSESRGQVSGQQAVGGLVGDMTGAVYYSSSATVVSGQRGVGGLVGLNTFGSVLGGYASGDVTGSNDIGGLVGVNTDAKVRNSYATGDVIGDANNVGGLVGFNSLSTVRNTYARGRVVGQDAVGGLVGRNNGVVSNSYASGSVSGDGVTGPVIGVVVEGREEATFSTDSSGTAANAKLAKLTGESSGWAPAEVPVTKALDYFCDSNRNGFIDPAEQTADNYIWSFGDQRQFPVLRCTPNGTDKQVN